MAKTIAVVGAGRVGQSLGRGLRRRGYRLGAVVTAKLGTARAATRFMGGGRPQARLNAAVARADVVLIATPDRCLAAVAASLARLEADWKRKLVLHTSGALAASELNPLAEAGAAVASLHPLFPFPAPLRVFPRGIVFGVEGDRRGVQQATKLARALGGLPITLRATDKPLYHAAAVLAAGHLMTLFDIAARLLNRAGVPRSRAGRALLPLAAATLQGYAHRGPEAWTGPLERGDAETVWHHLVALKELPPHFREVYLSLARAALALYRPGSRRVLPELRRLLRS